MGHRIPLGRGWGNFPLNPSLQLVRAVQFNCAHSYKVKEWTKDRNLKEFGACFSPTGHGHSYRLECSIEGAVDVTSGMIINLRDLDLMLKEVIKELDGRFLDKEVPEFLNQVPTTENIALWIFAKLEKQIAARFPETPLVLKKIRLFETEDLWVDCEASL